MKEGDETTQEGTRWPFEGVSCAEMMERMQAQGGPGFDCQEMMSRMMDQDAQNACAETMQKMRAMCCGQGDTAEKCVPGSG